MVLLTTGRSAATEQEVVASIESVGTRLVTVTDTTGNAGIAPSVVGDVERLAGVTWAFGLGPATDARNSDFEQAGAGVAVRALFGSLPADVPVTSGRPAVQPGEALAGVGASDVLRLSDVVGRVSDGQTSVGVVGQVDAIGPLSFVDELVLRIPAADEELPVRYVYVLVDDATNAREVATAVTALLPPGGVEVETSDGAIALRDVVAGRLGSASRQLMAAVLGCGLVLVSVTMLGAVAARRRDFGRRRALGASRSAIVTLVLVQSALAGAIGALVGAGTALGWSLLSGLPLAPWQFVMGLCALAVLVTLVGSAPPALTAASRDPVRILRVP
ncbi:FtsX-like permease family protein [Cellulomonas algicola]|uniref:FtsX-like permease family protein n=1 Tax=Cellulomonas algicola TaxID=2071633 RepID=UPI0027DF288D|nr:FtsX-like permease family protein [Cellulomonas algicola]